MNYNDDDNDCIKYIPINWMVKNKIEITVKGIDLTVINIENPSLSDLLNFSSKVTKDFMNCFKYDYAFSDPYFAYIPAESKAVFSIGVISIDEYNQRMEKIKQTDKKE